MGRFQDDQMKKKKKVWLTERDMDAYGLER